ncbi:DUF2254 domain-containing protein [Streptosporangium sp. DT93]|uniref:DUF2254 domain-containing protein n=1 Tax=Streptosporangium sp. DT93 TaxID=3393428 RepID=UPI003CFA3B6B
MRGRLNALGEHLGTQLWPLPTLGVGLAVALGISLPQLDARIHDDLPPWLRNYLFGGEAGAARTVLDAIASSLITVTALTFSLTVVTLQLASSQFSPRLLRTFTRDRFVQTTLALFLATFTYALTVLRTVRATGDAQEMFVPQASVTLAFLLTVASVLSLVLFLSHLAQEIRVETMLRNVHADADRTVRRLLPEPPSPREQVVAPPRPPADAVPLPAGASGFLSGVDEVSLLAAAFEADAVVLIQHHPGSSLVAGTPIGFGWPHGAGPFPSDVLAHLRQRVATAVSTGFERTGAQDIGFGLRQLTDVATKALSPGINDPTTAVHALSHSSALLCELAGRDLGPRLLRDDRGRVRVVLCRPQLGDLLELAVAQPRRYGASDPFVLARLSSLLRELAWCAGREHRQTVAGQLARLRTTIAAQDFDATERAWLAELTEQVDQAMAGRWPPGGSTS